MWRILNETWHIVQRFWSTIPLWRQLYNVGGTWSHFTLQVYVICHFWTPICNVLGYRRHHSICYTCLFTTPLVVITISGYNVSWPSDVVSRSGLLISSDICSVISRQCLYLGVSVSSMSVSLLSLSLCQSQSHIATDGQSISKSWYRAPSGAHDQIFISAWKLRSCFRGAPSLTRGRVCLLYVPLALASAAFLGS
jgi:hypothetical protein